MNEFNVFEDSSQYKPKKGGGKGWVYAVLIVASLVVGGLATEYGKTLFESRIKTDADLQVTTSPMLSPTVMDTASVKPTGAQTQAADIQYAEHYADQDKIRGSIPDIVDAMGPSVVVVNNKVKDQTGTEVDYGTGSGVIIDSQNGYIVTNNHVVEGASSVTVTLSTGEEIPATIKGTDANTDLAVLKVERANLPAMPVGDSSKVRVGETVIAIGSPLGKEFANSVTSGIISAVDRQVDVSGMIFNMLQTDAAINLGNSGGALMNMNGELIGINTLKSVFAGSDSGMPIAAEGIGFAIPVNELKPIVEDLIHYGFVRRPVIGISGRDIAVNDNGPEKHPQGILISNLRKGGAADKGGMLVDDIIIKVDGAVVKDFSELYAIIQNHEIGDKLVFTVWRDGAEKDVTIELEMNQPSAE